LLQKAALSFGLQPSFSGHSASLSFSVHLRFARHSAAPSFNGRTIIGFSQLILYRY